MGLMELVTLPSRHGSEQQNEKEHQKNEALLYCNTMGTYARGQTLL